MNYIPTQEELAMLKQKVKHLYCKLELLDREMNLVASLEGLTMDGTISIDADSGVRRTFSATIYIEGNKNISTMFGDEWVNKRVRLYLGMSPSNGKTYWYSQGVFAFSQNTFSYSETEHTLKISGVDLTAELDGTLGGALTGQATKIYAGADIGNSIATTYRLSGMNDCVVGYWNRSVPYDLEYDTGVTIWQILTELRDLYYPFEMYFDDTTFVCKEIATGYDSPLIMTAEDFEDLVISEECTYDYSAIRNCVELWGASVEYDAYAAKEKVSVSESGDTSTIIAKAIFTSMEDQPSELTVAFCTPVSGYKKNVKVQIDLTLNLQVPDSNGNITTTTKKLTYGPILLYARNVDDKGNDVQVDGTTLPKDTVIVVKYDNSTKHFYYQGEQQIHVMVKLVDTIPTTEEQEKDKEKEDCKYIRYVCLSNAADVNWDNGSRFTIEKLGRRNEILSGDEYENYTTNESAMNCAEYKHWTLCRLTDSVTVECLLVPWLDVNQKLAYRPKYINTGNQPVEFLTKTINISLGEGTMTVTMSRYWPYYPYIVKNKY